MNRAGRWGMAVGMWLRAGSTLAATPVTGPVWPAAPDPPRLRWVRSLPDPVQAERPSFLGRLLRLVTGEEDSAVAAARGLARPTGICGRAGVLFVADPGRRGIVRLDVATGRVEMHVPAGRERLVSPVGIAAAPDGGVWVADSGLADVRRLDARFRRTATLAVPGTQWIRPTGLAFDEARGRLYVADTGRHRIEVFRADGTHLTGWGRRGPARGELNFPTYLWVDRGTGDLLVCDAANFRIQRFSADGDFKTAFGAAGDRPGYLPRPRGVAMDPDGQVWVVDGALEGLQAFDAAGRFLLSAGTAGSEPGEFSLPGGVWIDPQGIVYVADTFNARIQVLRYLGTGAS